VYIVAPPENKGSDDDDDDGTAGKATLCHVPPGNPANEHTIRVGRSAVAAHLKHGDYQGPCDGRNAGKSKKGGSKGNSKSKGKGKKK
jgi:hypothetical protein